MAQDTGSKPLLLLVEDDPDDIDLARIALERSGILHRLVVAKNGKEALDYLFGEGRWAERDVRETPDVVLLDLKLPLVGGKEVLRRIRAREGTRRIPVVILSSSDETGDVAECYALGANSYFRKPVDFGDFTDGVSVLLYYWLAVNAPAQEGYEVRTAGEAALPPHLAPPSRLLPLKATGETLASIGTGARAPVVVIDPDPVARQATVGALGDLVRNEPVGGAADFDHAAGFLLSEGVCTGGDPWRCPHLLVLDVGPDGAGLEALRRIRVHMDQRLAIVVFTENADPALVSACYAAQASGYVLKPKDPEDYRNVVRMLGFYWLKLNLTPPARTIPTPA